MVAGNFRRNQPGRQGVSLSRTEAPEAPLAALGLCQAWGTRSKSPLSAPVRRALSGLSPTQTLSQNISYGQDTRPIQGCSRQ